MPWHLLNVELVVGAWIFALLAGDVLFRAAKPRGSAASRLPLSSLALLGVGVAAAALAWQQPSGETFQAMFRVDPFAALFKWLFLFAAGVVIIMTIPPPAGGRQSRPGSSSDPACGLPAGGGTIPPFHPAQPLSGSFYVLLLTALLGTLVLASAEDLLLLFLGLELLTFSLYIMTAYLRTDAGSVEAGMKYLILGSVSSGLLVYGIALLYGLAGRTDFPSLRQALSAGQLPVAGLAGLWLILAGLGFKVAAVPFHGWVPDVYQGAPTPVVAWLSVASKTAGVVAMLRLLYGVALPLADLWVPVLATSSAATMCYGNFGAIPQTNIKRLLGYSSIGHAGYLLMGLSSASVSGVQAVGYYLLASLFSTLAVFLVVVVVQEATGTEELEGYRGLSKRSGWLSAAMFMGVLSLAGVPPLAGFVGKLLVLLATAEQQRLWLVGIGAVNVAIALSYYLMIVKRMYLEEPANASPILVTGLTKLTLGLLMLGILAAGIVQAPFLDQFARIHP